MYQYDDATAVASLPVPAASGTPGYFTDGSPGTQSATVLRADFMNMLMMEMLNVVTAGGQAPSKTTYNQLLLAIENLIEVHAGNYALDTGAANAYVVALSPAIAAYTNGMSVRFRAAHANTGASTLNAGGGVVSLLNDIGGALSSGDLPAGAVVTAVYDSTAAAFLITSLVSSQALTALQAQQQSYAISAAGGTADAITGSYTPAIAALTNGMSLYVRATSANATTTPTFTPNSGTIAAKTIVKGNGLALAAGDIAGGGHWIELQYDATLDKWVLLNPATGAGTVTATNDASFADNSSKPASTSWIRGAMSAIATAAGFVISKASTGYIKFPSWLGGLIIQWGRGNVTVGTGVGVTFPIAFPTSALAITISGPEVGSGGSCGYIIRAGTPSLSGFTIYWDNFNTSGNGATLAANWICIGY